MLGDELRKARKAAGLTQEQLAYKAEIHPTYVSILERDKKSPTLEMLFRLCDAIGIRASDIIARVEESSLGHQKR
jgi:transcriptional regulator with XRE-family HTH domain